MQCSISSDLARLFSQSLSVTSSSSYTVENGFKENLVFSRLIEFKLKKKDGEAMEKLLCLEKVTGVQVHAGIQIVPVKS